MGFEDFSSGVSDSRRQAAMDNRAIAQSSPESDRGMSFDDFDDFPDFDSLDDVSSSGGMNAGYGGGMDNSFGGGMANSFGNSSMGGGFDNSFGGGMGMNSGPTFNSGADFGMSQGGFNNSYGSFGNDFGMQPQQQQQGGTMEEKLGQAAVQLGKNSVTFFKDFMQSVKTFDAEKRSTMGRYAMVTGIIIALVSVALMIFGRFMAGAEMLIGSLVSTGTGVIMLCFGQSDVASAPPQQQASAIAHEPAPQIAPMAGDEDEIDFNFDAPVENNAVDDDATAFDAGFAWNDEDASDDEDEDIFGSDVSLDAEEDEDDEAAFAAAWDTVEATSAPAVTEAVDIADAIDNLENLSDTGLIDRRALFEKAMSVLQSVNPNFGINREIGQDEEQFRNLDAICQDSAERFKPDKTTELPYLVSAVDTPFYIRMEITRPKYMKNIQDYIQEIVKVFQYDKVTGKTDRTIYGIGDAVASKIYLKLMKGAAVSASLKDLYNVEACRNAVVNIDNKMPVVLGVDIEGAPIVRDFSNMHSILITGMPRSGKSWLLKSVLWQMMLYSSPKDLQFYFCDPKAGISDFTTEVTPHVRKFVSADNDIVALLKYLVRVEGPRRKTEMGNSGFIDIKDYRKANPNCDMPIIYVVIDEVVTLADRMDVDTKKEFQGLLSELVSQLPAAGIRIFLVPHLVKDNIIKKNVTAMIPCRISVLGDAQHIEDSCGAKNFKHILRYPGDTCTKLLGDPEPMFVHNCVLANSNDDAKMLFNYLGELWARLEPETVAGSVYERKKNGLCLFDDNMSGLPTEAPADVPRAKKAANQGTAVEQFMQNTGIIDTGFSAAMTGNNTPTRGDNQILNNPVEQVNLFDDDF